MRPFQAAGDRQDRDSGRVVAPLGAAEPDSRNRHTVDYAHIHSNTWTTGMRKPSSIRLPQELSDRVDRLSAALERPRSWVIERAIAAYLDDQEWQVAKIREALDDVRAGTAALVTHQEVAANLDRLIEQTVGSRPDHAQPEDDAADRVA